MFAFPVHPFPKTILIGRGARFLSWLDMYPKRACHDSIISVDTRERSSVTLPIERNHAPKGGAGIRFTTQNKNRKLKSWWGEVGEWAIASIAP